MEVLKMNVNMQELVNELSNWGATMEVLKRFPQDILEEFQFILDNKDQHEDKLEYILDLGDLWQVSATPYFELKEVAEGISMPVGELTNLPAELQQKVIGAYKSGADYWDIYRLCTDYMETASLEKVSKFLNVPLEKLKSLSRQAKNDLCGFYDIFYEENGDNTVIAKNMQKIIEREEEL